SSQPTSPVAIVEELRPIVDKLQRWLPNAVLSNGVVELDQQQIVVRDLAWKQRRLEAQVELPQQHQEGRISVIVTGSANAYHLELTSESLHLNSSADVVVDAGRLNLLVTNLWQGNRIDLQARFGANGNL